MIGRGRLGPMPWGEVAVLMGIWLGLAAFLGPRLLIEPTAEAFDARPDYTDYGDALEKAGQLAAYADLRLVRAAAGNALPEPPELLGDPRTARIAWAYAIGATGLFIVVAHVASRRTPGKLAADTGLNRFDFDRLWIPGLAVAVVYLAVGGYTRAVDELGWSALQSDPGGLETTLRDPVALALYGVTTVVTAPIGEEYFYRGLIFGGLSGWGFLPAAAVSSALFAFSHLDPGTLIPFVAVGMVLSWLFWRSGSLWDAIAFHVLFNFLSFILLLART